MQFIWWGINVFLGCLFGLEAFYHRYLHDSSKHNCLHFGALIVFLTFSLISLVILLYESLPATIGDVMDPIFLLAPVLCTFGLLLQYFGYALLLKKLYLSSHDK
ncbi:hypothetical protein [Paenibacillus sp. GP183]|uniref:hypothetical protein n=1 Tax=Paenibacillus sp. GP183 TaxID=1882751 RepID=UPI00089547C8|nr:hypothetical protein [Paenibacillus sp. GP183]SEC81813.1 hypothetical protein SAMN05443246_5484 [Paenibacillus sp. GP183]